MILSVSGYKPVEPDLSFCVEKKVCAIYYSLYKRFCHMEITFTTVTTENSEAFLHLAPQGFLSGEYLEDKKAVGALTGKRGSFVPAALMIIFIGFTGYEKSVEVGPSIAVKWFMVDEEYRLQGIGRACFEKLYSLGRQAYRKHGCLA